jgi:hypothetical protein
VFSQLMGYIIWNGKVIMNDELLMMQMAGFPPRHPGFEPRRGHVGFVVEKVAQGQVFYDYLGFPCQFSFHRLLHTHHHLSSGAGTIGQLEADVPSGLSLTPPQETKEETKLMMHGGGGTR